MQSENIYKLGKIKLEKSKSEKTIRAIPSAVIYEAFTDFNPEFTLAMPCRVISLSRYEFEDNFSLISQNSDVYDIIYIYGGTVGVSCGESAFTAKKNDVIFLHMSRHYEITQIPGSKLDILIMRSSGYLSMSYHQLIMGGADKSIAIKSPEEFDRLFGKILYYMRYPTNLNNILMVNVMSQIYTELYMNIYGAADRDSVYSHPKWFVDTVDYIEKNYSRDINIKKFISEFHISESHFYRIFKNYTGLSPYQYLIRVRINRAQTLLTSTQYQIKYIAYTVGFDSVNHFISYFKRQTGYTPAEYQKNKRDK